jgi:FAD-dependent oxidoreductase domain-containing protein 1
LEDTDLLVIGAGILGVASAYHILRNNPGKKVLVVDRYGAAGQGNTGRSNAMFRNTFSSKDNQILANASIDYYLHTQNEAKKEIGLQQIGYLWLMSENQLSSSEPHLRSMQGNGIETSRLSMPDLAQRIPGLVSDGDGIGQASFLGLPKIEAGVFGPKCGRLDPDKLTRYYAHMYTDLGGRFAFGTEAKRLHVGAKNRLGFEGEPFPWQDYEVTGVELEGRLQGTIHAGTVVLACGAWGNQLLEPIGIDGHVKAKKRQLFSIRAESTPLQHLTHSRWFNPLGLLPLVILPKAGVHFKPVAEERAFWAACEDNVRPYLDIPDNDLESYRAEPEFYERSVKPVLSGYFPEFSRTLVKAMWAGLYSYNTLDYLPFAFREKNLIVVGGDSGSGIMKGDSLGRVVDALYRNEEEAELYGGAHYRVSKLSFEHRDVEREEWVI